MTGDRWGGEAPPLEAYARVTEPERFHGLHEFAVDLLGRKVVSTRGCPTTRPSVTSPIPSRASSPRLEERTSCKRTTVRRWWTALTR